MEFGKLQLELLYKLDQQLIDREEAQYEVERFWVGALRDAVVDGQVERGSLMAGQSVGLVDKIQPLHAIMQEMIDDAEKELQRLSRLLSEKEAPNDAPTSSESRTGAEKKYKALHT